jgi:hypothetical protein
LEACTVIPRVGLAVHGDHAEVGAEFDSGFEGVGELGKPDVRKLYIQPGSLWEFQGPASI